MGGVRRPRTPSVSLRAVGQTGCQGYRRFYRPFASYRSFSFLPLSAPHHYSGTPEGTTQNSTRPYLVSGTKTVPTPWDLFHDSEGPRVTFDPTTSAPLPRKSTGTSTSPEGDTGYPVPDRSLTGSQFGLFVPLFQGPLPLTHTFPGHRVPRTPRLSVWVDLVSLRSHHTPPVRRSLS